MTTEKTQKAGVIALIFSFLIPIVGVICYFVNRKQVVNASSYLWSALAGVAVSFVLQILAAMASA